MLFIFLLCLASIAAFVLLRNMGAKKLFNVPWYYIVMSLDIGGAKGKMYSYNGVNGIPDAVFKHVLLPKVIVGELKGRVVHNGAIRSYEFAQIQLYIGMLKKKSIFGRVTGRLAYKHEVILTPYNSRVFKEIIGMKKSALKVLNQFQ